MRRKKAAAYARVSTKDHGQEHSFQYQSDYWNSVLTNDPNYDYVGLYADKGISGKYASRRPQFLALLEACRNGEVDIVFTKSVQRFGRNTEELLTAVRELRELGVAVVFEKEGIDTLKPDSELYLTIAAAVAEDDLSRYSQSVVWSIADKFRKGENVMGYRLYGYTVIENRDLVINEEEAKVVRQIYDLYITGEWTPRKIADLLNDSGIPSALGRRWTDSSIRDILKNEKYKGDLLLQKFYKENGMRVRNYGGKPQYYVENNHDPIVSQEVWDKAQEILASRSNKKLIGHNNATYPFTGMIVCGKCGHPIIHKVNNSGTPHQADFWKCRHSIKCGRAVCDNPGIKDTVLKEKFVEVFNEFLQHDYVGVSDKAWRDELARLYAEEKELMRAFARGYITKTAYESEQQTILGRIKEIEKCLSDMRVVNLQTSRGFKAIEYFDEDIYHRFVRKVTLRDWVVTFEFYNGATVSRTYTNGQHGNIQDWVKKHRRRKQA